MHQAKKPFAKVDDLQYSRWRPWRLPIIPALVKGVPIFATSVYNCTATLTLKYVHTTFIYSTTLPTSAPPSIFAAVAAR